METTDKTKFWVAIPGSQTPPLGPIGIDEVARQMAANALPADATVCKVGDSAWVSVGAVLPPISEPVPSPSETKPKGERPAVKASFIELRREFETRYVNLRSVGENALGAGATLKVLGWALLALGVLALLGAFFTSSGAMGGGGIAAMFVGVGAYISGLLVAALGEALLGLRDIAVNTRISAERRE